MNERRSYGTVSATTGSHSLWQEIRVHRELRPSHEALVFIGFDGREQRWTYEQLVDRIERVAGSLEDRGLTPGSKVLVVLDNCPEFVVTLLATLAIGAVAAVVNPQSAPPELADFVSRTAPSVIVTSADRVPLIRSMVPDATLIFATGAQGGSNVAQFNELFRGEPLSAFQDISPMDPAGIQFTSGTSSRPKGVVWTHANYVWGARASARHQRLTPDDRYLTVLPLFHTNAQMYSVLPSLLVGSTVVLVPKFSASRFWPIAVQERTTWASVIPFITGVLRSQPVPAHSFRHWGNALFVPSWDRYFGLSTVAWWGMTETVSQVVVSDPGVATPPGAIGRTAPDYGVRLVDRIDDTGRLQVHGTPGMSMFLEYLDEPHSTEKSWTDDGYFDTGDRVRVDDQGFVTFVDRDKDMLKVGGENVASSEIERVVRMVPGVADAAVVGIADPLLNEVPVVFVVSNTSAPPISELRAGILDACQRSLASFKVPRDVSFVEALPTATLGKVRKNALRDMWHGTQAGEK